MWGAPDWTAADIEGTHIAFEVQVGDELEWSPEGPWLAAGQFPEDPSPVSLRELLSDPHPVLHVRVTMTGDQRTPPFRSPELLRLGASFTCPGDVD